MSHSKIPKTAKKVFHGIIFDVYQWQQEQFDGSFATWEVAARHPVVSIIPIVGDKLVILHEEQPGNHHRISFPGGRIDPGEKPLQAAIRELKEETGMTFKNVRLAMVEDIGGGKMEWTAYRFIATGHISTSELKEDPGERIRVELVDFARAKELSTGNLFMSLEIMSQVESLEELINFQSPAKFKT